MKPTVSVIIPTTLHGFTHMARLMPMLAQECKDFAEIIIVDNASRDGTLAYLSNYECVVIVNKTNQGFAKANNRASEHARGEYLLFLNNDTAVNPGILREMVKTFDTDPKIGIVGALVILMGNTKKVQHIGVCFTPEYIPYELGLEKPDITPQIPFNDPRTHAVRRVPAVTAACMMVKKSVYDEVGGFDEDYINGWEDNDLCLKVREKGYEIYYNGNASIYHMHFGSPGRLAFEAQNRLRYDKTWVHTGRAKNVLGNFREG